MKRNFTIRFLSIALLFLPYLSKAQYCTSFPGAGCSVGDYISNFTLTGTCSTSISNLATTCPATSNAFDDRTAQTPVKLLQGATYSGTISSGRIGDYAAIWIDFNNNGTFEASELVGTVGTYSSTPIATSAAGTAFSITIPPAASAPMGTYRMRIRMVYNVSPSTIDPCTAYTYGEVRDYSVSIIPASPVASSNSPVCSGRPLTLFATDTSTGAYSWTGPASFTQQNPVISNATTANTGTYTVTVTVNGVSSCPVTTHVTVNASPAATINPTGSNTFCADSFTLAANTGADLSYAWLNSGVNTGVTTANYKVFTGGSYQVAVSNANCTDTSATTTLTLNPIPAATITPLGATSFCDGGNVVLQANAGAGLTYQWQNSGGTIIGETNATYTATASDNYKVTVSNGTCTATSAVTTVTVNSVPVATVTVQGSVSICQGQSVLLKAAPAPGYTYQWENASGNIGGATDSAYTATTSGSYTVIVSNGPCADTSVATPVLVHPVPSAVITPQGPTTFCNGQNVVLQATTGAGFTYQWENSTGDITAATNSAYTATTSDNYTVIVSNGNCADTSTVTTVTVNPVPAATITPQGTITLCQGQSVVLHADTGTGYTYQWQNSGGAIGGATDSTYTATTTDNYTVVVTGGSCADTSAADTVTVNAVPVAVITTTTPTSFCQGATITLHTDSAANLTYQWLVDGNSIPGTDDSLFTTDASGTYSVIVTNASNCSDTSAGIVVTAYPLPNDTIAIQGHINFCSGDSVTLSVDTCTSCTFVWYDNGTATTDTTTSYTTDTSGNIYVVINNAIGCSVTSTTIPVTVNNTPVASVTYTGDTTFCGGDSLVLSTTTGPNYTYQWENAGAAISGATNSSYAAIATGSYTVVIVNGCADSSSATNVLVNPMPDTVLTISGQVNFCSGDSVTLSVDTCTSCTFLWYDNGIATADTTNTITTDTTGNYYVVITDGIGCSGISATAPVTVNQTPADSVTYTGSNSLCIGDSLVLHAHTDNGISYQWINGGAVVAGATDSTYTVSVTGSYSVAIANIAGCADTSAAVPVNILPIPVTSINVTTTTTFCEGGSVVLHGHPTTGVTYQWFLNDTLVAGITGVSFTVTQPGSYTLVASNAAGCGDTSTATVVTVIAPPAAVVTSATADTFCQGGNVVLSTDTGTGYTYHWQKNSVNITGATTVTYTATATGNYRVIIANSTGCTDTSAITAVFVNPLPTAVITASGTTFCIGGQVTLNGTVAANDTYQWNINTLAIPGATDASYTTDSGGSYTVTITDTLTTCIATSLVRQVTVNTPPTVAITGGPTAFCQNDSVVFTANAVSPPGSVITHYLWDNNGTAITGATHSSYTATTAGSYTVTVTSSTGCMDTSTADTVIVHPLPPSVATAAGPASVCPGGIVVLNANIDTGLTYFWQDNGVAIPNDTTTTYIASTSGSYAVVTTDYYGCMLASPPVVVLIDTPTAIITPEGPTTVCQNNIVVLDANTGNNYTYQWEMNNNPIPNANGASYTASVAGNYTVVVTNGTGCTATSDPTQITINPLPTVTVTAIGAASFCVGDSVTLVAAADTIVTYQWYEGPNIINGATDSSYAANASAPYVVVVTNGYNCSTASAPIDVTANPLPVATITPEGSTTVCVNGSVVLDATPGAGYIYQWYLNDTAIPGATNGFYTAATSGNYTVAIISSTNCSSLSAITTVTIYPQPTLMAQNPTTFCVGSSVNLYANTSVQNTTDFAYQWQNNGVTINGATDSVYTAYIAGTYNCVVIASNGCTSLTDFVTVTVNPLPDPVIVPNGNTLTTGNFVTYQWYENHSAINGANGQSVTVLDEGIYYVAVSDSNGCVSVSDVYNTANLGVTNTQNIGNEIKIYPNPANAMVHIDAPVNVNISVSGLDGRMVIRKDQAKDVDVSQLANGVYMITIYDQNGALLKIDKLVKTAY